MSFIGFPILLLAGLLFDFRFLRSFLAASVSAAGLSGP
jgi:hypothetical protein